MDKLSNKDKDVAATDKPSVHNANVLQPSLAIQAWEPLKKEVPYKTQLKETSALSPASSHPPSIGEKADKFVQDHPALSGMVITTGILAAAIATRRIGGAAFKLGESFFARGASQTEKFAGAKTGEYLNQFAPKELKFGRPGGPLYLRVTDKLEPVYAPRPVDKTEALRTLVDRYDQEVVKAPMGLPHTPPGKDALEAIRGAGTGWSPKERIAAAPGGPTPSWRDYKPRVSDAEKAKDLLGKGGEQIGPDGKALGARVGAGVQRPGVQGADGKAVVQNDITLPPWRRNRPAS